MSKLSLFKIVEHKIVYKKDTFLFFSTTNSKRVIGGQKSIIEVDQPLGPYAKSTLNYEIKPQTNHNLIHHEPLIQQCKRKFPTKRK